MSIRNEICATLIGVLDDIAAIDPKPEEVEQVRWVTADEMLKLLRDDPISYCPWMIIALYFMRDSKKDVVQKHTVVLKDWLGEDVRAQFLSAIEKHLSRDKWRILS